jgi:putative phosphoribosyl transferase
MLFANRREAGRILAQLLYGYAGRENTIVLGLPRGGIPVAFEVAQRLGIPLDALLVRKLGVPGHEELAMGAIARDAQVINADVVEGLGIDPQEIERVSREEERELERREAAYRPGRPALSLEGKLAIVVDDGLATGATMRAAVQALRALGAARIIVAVPVGAPSSCAELSELADEVVCPVTPEPFFGVGLWYADFEPTTDDEVRALLAQAGASGATVEAR